MNWTTKRIQKAWAADRISIVIGENRSASTVRETPRFVGESDGTRAIWCGIFHRHCLVPGMAPQYHFVCGQKVAQKRCTRGGLDSFPACVYSVSVSSLSVGITLGLVHVENTTSNFQHAKYNLECNESRFVFGVAISLWIVRSRSHDKQVDADSA